MHGCLVPGVLADCLATCLPPVRSAAAAVRANLWPAAAMGAWAGTPYDWHMAAAGAAEESAVAREVGCCSSCLALEGSLQSSYLDSCLHDGGLAEGKAAGGVAGDGAAAVAGMWAWIVMVTQEAHKLAGLEPQVTSDPEVHQQNHEGSQHHALS